MKIIQEDNNQNDIYYWNGVDNVPKDVVNVVIEDGVERIPIFAFDYCRSLQSVEIPNSVRIIWIHAFSNCKSLKSINIPNGVEYIGSDAFSVCTSLEEVILPDSIRRINTLAFIKCPNLTIYFNKGNEYLEDYCRNCNIDYEYL